VSASAGSRSDRAHACGPAAYWFWDRVPDRAQAQAQVAEIVRAGIGMVMIQARLSLPREQYLSSAYLRAYRDAVLAAGAAGLEVGVYDEYNWISGHGGGRTVTGAGHLRERHLLWTTSVAGAHEATISQITSEWVDGLGAAGARWIYEDGVRRWDAWELVAAVAHPAGDVVLSQTVDVSAWTRVRGGDDGCTVSLQPGAPVPVGWEVTFFVSARCASSRLVNLLDPRAAQRFLEVVYEPYLTALEGLIGDPVTCFSFDHPYGGFYTWRERAGDMACSLLWDPAAGLAGDDRRCLLALVREVGPGTVGARCRFFAAYAARGTESFLGTLSAWTAAHGVGLTGHELLAHVGGFDLYGAFPSLDIRASFGGDYFAVDAARTETLVDASNFAAQLSPMMGDSVARAHGRGRCIVEQYAARRDPPQDYAAGYWELSLAELRLQALRLHLLGARRFLVHAVAESHGSGADEQLLANPRFDFPPAVNFEPWFGAFAAFAAESEAVSRFIEEGEPVREIALVYPLHTLWAEGQSHPHGALFGAWAQLCARSGVGVDIVDDRELDDAVVRDGRLWLGRGGDRGYRAVIVPGMSVVVSAQTMAVLDGLRAAGGVVVVSAPAPVVDRHGAAVAWSGEVCDGVPPELPAALRAVAGGPAVDVADGPGTMWRWMGHDRVVLLNDGPERRTVTIGAGAARASVQLEPEEVRCETLPIAHDSVLPVWEPVLALADGWTLAVDGDSPVVIDPARGWELQSLPAFSGVGSYRCEFDVEGDRSGGAWALELPVVHCTAAVRLGGVALGERGWPPYRFVIPHGRLAAAGNELVIEVASSAANRFYAGTRFQHGLQPSGLGAAPRLVREVSAAR
jgi:hypothetical protein